MTWAAKRYFTSKRKKGEPTPYDRHPRQPVGLKPMPLTH
jgi:hypothetical protein